MYTPSHFEESRKSVLHSLMRAHPLAALVAQTSHGFRAEHIPLLVLESGEANGVLQGHLARANPFWQDVPDGSEVLAIFQGPNGYVSPNWYPSKHEHGKAVPTWNYLAVQARGRIRWHEDPAWLRAHLEAATDAQESEEEPWRITDAPSDFIERKIRAIVGFEIPMSELKGKWKLSQNRSERDRRGVIAGLSCQSGPSAAEMLRWMEEDDEGA